MRDDRVVPGLLRGILPRLLLDLPDDLYRLHGRPSVVDNLRNRFAVLVSLQLVVVLSPT